MGFFRGFLELLTACQVDTHNPEIDPELPGGSWDLVSKVMGTLIGVICAYRCSYIENNLGY